MAGGGEGGSNCAGGGGAADVVAGGGGDGLIRVRRGGKDPWGVQTLTAPDGLSDGVVGSQEGCSPELLIKWIQTNFLKKPHLLTLPQESCWGGCLVYNEASVLD